MKRPATARVTSKRTGDVRKDLTQDQLAWIGSVALAFNEAELLLDIIVGFGFGAVTNIHELTSRINGVEGKIALAKIGADELKASETFKQLLSHTLGEAGLSLLKKLRDRIIHARILDATSAIAESPAQRGKFDEILLTKESLEAVYKRLDIIRNELISALKIIASLFVLERIQGAAEVAVAFGNAETVQRKKAEIESRIQEWIARLQQYQRDRLSLPPLPEFPSESELNAVDAQARQDRQDEALSGTPLADLPQRLAPQGVPPVLLRELSKSGDKKDT